MKLEWVQVANSVWRLDAYEPAMCAGVVYMYRTSKNKKAGYKVEYRGHWANNPEPGQFFRTIREAKQYGEMCVRLQGIGRKP